MVGVLPGKGRRRINDGKWPMRPWSSARRTKAAGAYTIGANFGNERTLNFRASGGDALCLPSLLPHIACQRLKTTRFVYDNHLLYSQLRRLVYLPSYAVREFLSSAHLLETVSQPA